MDFTNIFKRYEIKFLLSTEQYLKLKEIMSSYMIPDKFGKSTINNIYFDTPDSLLIRRSLEKPLYKEKLRMRSYGKADENSTAFVEIKKKYKGVVYKRRISMQEKEATDYLVNGHKPDKVSQILKEIDYFISFYKELKPAMALSYEREAFFSKTDKNFRMTFDQNILARDYDLSLTSEIYGEKILPENTVLLEVKTAIGMPRWLLEFLSKNKIYKTSYSKYGTAYTQSLLKNLKQKSGGNKNVA